MNLEDLSISIRNDIEDQSLEILRKIKDDILVIGGWACRALVKDKHKRYTLDVDGIADSHKFSTILDTLTSVGVHNRDFEWGIQFFTKYEPTFEVNDTKLLRQIRDIELRIEISEPKIKEKATHHYFKFDPDHYVTKTLEFHNKDERFDIKVPTIEEMAAVKLGLPVDYKNNFDSALLITSSNIDKVLKYILKNDDWADLVLRRLKRSMSRLRDKSRLEHMLLKNARINLSEVLKNLKTIESSLL